MARQHSSIRFSPRQSDHSLSVKQPVICSLFDGSGRFREIWEPNRMLNSVRFRADDFEIAFRPKIVRAERIQRAADRRLVGEQKTETVSGGRNVAPW